MSTSDVYKKEYDVIIVGGGATGAGTARDCALRGLKVLLVERNDYSTGATGRNHGLMHSGARYAVTDGESASECISENMILRRIARHCVEETDGLFITLPEDDLEYQKTFVEACGRAGIRADVIDPEEARRIEPAVNPALIGAVRVPDAAIDPFRLTVANLLDARMHGAETLNYHEVEGVIINQNRVEGLKLFNKLNGEHVEVRGRVTVNAAGIWGQRIAQMAGVNISMFPARGALLIFGHRVNNMVINRCRKPANADILVPDDTVCVIGTTSDRIPIETVNDMRVTREELDVLLKEGVHDTHHPRLCRRTAPGSQRRRPQRTQHQPRHSVPRPRPTRRTGGLYHHHGRQDDDLPPDGRNRYQCRMRQAGQHSALRHRQPAAAGL